MVHIQKKLNPRPYSSLAFGLESATEIVRNLIIKRFDHFFQGIEYQFLYEKATLKAMMDSSFIGNLLTDQEIAEEEFLIFLITLIPHFHPGFYGKIINKYLPEGGDFPDFGGCRGQNYRGFLPTAETVIFLLGGKDASERFKISKMLGPDSFLVRYQIIKLGNVSEGEPLMSGALHVNQDLLEKIAFGKILRPQFSNLFGAEYISTRMEWKNLVLHPSTRDEIEDIRRWLDHHEVFLHTWKMGRKINPGYKVLFYGPPGTGKTLTATLLGKHTGLDVFRIDLSATISKYIGETEKNLARIFNRAHDKQWILFFDEADALFGKRTHVKDAQDRFANQEVAYLLQKIEHYPGLVILSSNFKDNLDEAFFRRFQSMIYFPMPNVEERLQLWVKSLPEMVRLEPSIDIHEVARDFTISGASILNVVQFASLRSLDKNSNLLLKEDLYQGLHKEMVKIGQIHG